VAVSRPITIVLAPFVAGIAAAPYVKPLLQRAFLASVGASIRLRTMAAEAVSDYQDLLAEQQAAQQVKEPAKTK
jgi:hypothetical protein